MTPNEALSVKEATDLIQEMGKGMRLGGHVLIQ
jgi:hypothetical protein